MSGRSSTPAHGRPERYRSRSSRVPRLLGMRSGEFDPRQVKAHYLIVARTVMTEVPDAFGPWPVALMAKLSLPLYLAFGWYSNVVKLSFFSLPCAGFCEIAESVTVPRIPTGSRQASPDLTSMSAVEFSPQSASVTDIEHSDGAGAADAGIKPGGPTTSTSVASFEKRVIRILVLMRQAPASFEISFAVTNITSPSRIGFATPKKRATACELLWR